MTTTLNNVAYALISLEEQGRTKAQEWIENDLYKKHLALAYDDYIYETELIGEEITLTLTDHIEYFLDHPHIIETQKEQSD